MSPASVWVGSQPHEDLRTGCVCQYPWVEHHSIPMYVLILHLACHWSAWLAAFLLADKLMGLWSNAQRHYSTHIKHHKGSQVHHEQQLHQIRIENGKLPGKWRDKIKRPHLSQLVTSSLTDNEKCGLLISTFLAFFPFSIHIWYGRCLWWTRDPLRCSMWAPWCFWTLLRDLDERDFPWRKKVYGGILTVFYLSNRGSFN